MVAKNHRPNHERYTKWSIRRLSVGVASVVVTSGFFILISNPVNAQVGSQNKVVTTTPSNSSTDFGKSILDSKVGQTESPSAEKKETPSTTKPSQDLSGKTTQTPDKKVQEKQEVTKENKVGKSVAEAAKKIQKASETVAKETASKAQEDPTLAQAKQSVADNIKGGTDVPASFLQNATHPGPFTAGVNEVIPYELFGGDGMLTRLLLKSSNGAPWSDNGTAKHAGLLPFANIPKGKYFYQASLDGNAAGKQGEALLDQLKANGTHTYTATVTVYGATKDGKADLNNVVATRQVKLNLNGTTTVDQVKKSVVDNIKDKIDVPASYLTNAVYPGPFTAGVNQVIPYELFGGDGMLTRLLLKSSNGAPWSDNGSAKHPGLLPLASLGKGQYFYQVSLDGNAAGKQDKALLEQLKANGTHLYKATVTVYGATKDGKADLKNVIATKSVTINLKGEKKADSKGQSQQGQNDQAQNQGKKADHDGSKHSNKGGTPSATTSKGGQATASKKSLPNTGQKSSLGLTVLGLLGLSAAAILALVGMKRREKK
ncbi:SSURE domain-containing protein [Streptococcus sp. HF-2466]|uniref:SSURE domain-containing protein n=1 Tax=Streptococcus sp. HF-2466 TaxID=2785792 RepID=UPI0018A108E4|nr:fibronectin-binding SSURE repeat-containing protein [Streptococcus sp. HF-2466]MBF7050814.1 fibronectin-binding SSURE repeat-containing protein [Streptococcus sp. HF-2466]